MVDVPAGAPDLTHASYRYTLDSTCGENALAGRYRVTVVDGRVSEVDPLDEQGLSPDRLLEVVPTIATLVDRATGPDAGAVRTITFDPATGVLRTLELDPVPTAVDDEECFEITNYTPAP